MDAIIKKINSSNWADWQLDDININFMDIKIKLSFNENNSQIVVICKNYIGVSFIGHWDESVIESINIQKDGKLIEESIQTVKKHYGDNPLPGGGTRKIDDKWYQININLIDGIRLNFVFNDIDVKE